MTFSRLALRDVVVIAATVAFWTWASPLTAGTGPIADFLGLLAGVAVALAFYLLHEWGHLVGALATSAVVYPGPRLSSRSLFSFDSKRNDRRQFLVMSVGGFVVTGIAVWTVYAGLPAELLATRVARGAVGVLAFLAIFVELPLVIWALVRSDLPPVEAFQVSDAPAADSTAT
jgi:hypothetical protein